MAESYFMPKLLLAGPNLISVGIAKCGDNISTRPRLRRTFSTAVLTLKFDRDLLKVTSYI